MSNNIKAIVFDLGNVLIDFDHMIAARRIANFANRSPHQIYSLFFDSEITQLFEEGGISPLDFFSEVKKILKLNLKFEEFKPLWNEIFFLTPKNLEIYKLKIHLKKNYTIALLSNINVLHFEYLKKNFSSSLNAFHKIFLSYQLHLRKPNSLIYDAVLKQLNLKAEEVFYTDDRLELIQAARSKGINSFQFINIDQLKSDLVNSDININ